MKRRDGSVLALVEHAVARAPRSVAVRGPDGSLTYVELWQAAGCLARRLRDEGVGPGDLVGQCLERSTSLIVAALGIARAGAAYVAIDPSYPDERIRWMLTDSRAAAVVTDAGTSRRLEGGSTSVRIILRAAGELEDPPAAGTDEPLPRSAGGSDLAYVVYTSGSTGRPKGAMIEHGGLANLVAWHRAAFALGASDRCTQIASPGFDAAVWEIWPALASGAAIHVVPEAVRTDPIGLRDWLLEQGITVTFLPTGVAESVIGLAWPDTCALRFLLTGGDRLTRRPSPRLGFTVVNNYGVSEAAVVATSGPVAPTGGAPSIGRPIAGVVAEVVDERLRPVPPGSEGELVIGGMAVGRGYLNQPELTRERFLDGPNGRRYRTGDRVRVRRDGDIEFLGRLDDQLSIRGFRVEPGEVAAVLNSHPAIAASVAVAAGRAAADHKLVAYVVAADGARPDQEELTAFAGRLLPEHMVPSRYVWLEELPLTTHGKIDRDALPDPADEVPDAAAASRPGTSLEEEIVSVVAELLERAEVGADQNFFLLGGHSMLGAQLITRLADRFSTEISLRYLFDHPTPAELAAEVERQLVTDEAAA